MTHKINGAELSSGAIFYTPPLHNNTFCVNLGQKEIGHESKRPSYR